MSQNTLTLSKTQSLSAISLESQKIYPIDIFYLDAIIAGMGWKGEAAAIGLALEMLAPPVAPIPQKIPQPIIKQGETQTFLGNVAIDVGNSRVKIDFPEKNPPNFPENQEGHRRHYQLALEIMEEFLKTSSDPFIQQTYAEALQDPSEHIGIVDNLGFKDHGYFPGGFSYLVFPEGRNDQDQESKPWSFAILVPDQLADPSQTFASIRIQLDIKGEVYTGGTDLLPGFDQISRSDLTNASNIFFNIPDEMRSLPLLTIPGETIFEPPTLERSYKEYLQAVTMMGIVMLIAPHPFPQREDVSEPTVPNMPLPNNPLI